MQLVEFVNGLFSLLFVSISILIGSIIILKYFEYKNSTLMLVGLTWIGICSPWWPSTVSFLVILITGEGISLQLFLFLGNFFIPIALLFWIIAFTNLLYKDKQKQIIVIFGSISALYEIVFLIFLFTNPTFLGTPAGATDVKTGPLVTIYQIFLLIVTLITGIVFSQESIKSPNKEIRLKGKLLMAAFLSFVIGAIMDVFSNISLIILIAGRIILILAAIEFYGGFLLPRWLKELLIRNEV
ncbi:MAG: hypothetical protein ACTSR8_17145 [Promethearchaeota archaeon]